ncbi:MAG: NUDIX hydrolase [Candidatus Solibacter usitatus]|nr:NUDIX hydrolase [Candidatus Solibacter usitatus]
MKGLKRKVLLETPIFRVSDNQLTDPAGKKIRRLLVEHDGSAVVLPVDEKGRVFLVRQYRLPAADYLWELPAGKIDPGETALQAAKRELREETGFRAKRWSKLITFYPSPGFQQEWMTIFLAQDLRQGERIYIEDEDLEGKWFSSATVERMIRNSRIVDAKTIIGYSMWKYFRKASR